MPPKPKFSKDEIVQAALHVVRQQGLDHLTIRQVAKELNISTQPIVSCFNSSASLHESVWEAADAFHSRYLMTVDPSDPETIALQIGSNYIRFAQEEPHLFELLFLSGPGPVGVRSLTELTEDPALVPMIETMAQSNHISMEQMTLLFRSLALYVHGYACLIAGRLMETDQKQMESDLTIFWQTYLEGLNGLERKEDGKGTTK